MRIDVVLRQEKTRVATVTLEGEFSPYSWLAQLQADIPTKGEIRSPTGSYALIYGSSAVDAVRCALKAFSEILQGEVEAIFRVDDLGCITTFTVQAPPQAICCRGTSPSSRLN